jgi:hypothetical protein
MTLDDKLTDAAEGRNLVVVVGLYDPATADEAVSQGRGHLSCVGVLMGDANDACLRRSVSVVQTDTVMPSLDEILGRSLTDKNQRTQSRDHLGCESSSKRRCEHGNIHIPLRDEVANVVQALGVGWHADSSAVGEDRKYLKDRGVKDVTGELECPRFEVVKAIDLAEAVGTSTERRMLNLNTLGFAGRTRGKENICKTPRARLGRYFLR